MFNLEQSIVDWRQQMLAAGIEAPVPLEELEIHLREEIERTMDTGANAQMTFEAAAGKIGRAGTLRREFEKVGGMTLESTRKLGVVASWVFTILLGAMAGLVLFAPFGVSAGSTWGERFLEAGSVMFFASLSWIWRVAGRLVPVPSTQNIVIAALLCAALGGGSTALVVHILSSWAVNTGSQFLTVGAWSLFPLMLLLNLVLVLMESEFRKNKSAEPVR